MTKRKAEIVKSETDKVQPYRVWSKGKIVFFARTLDEATEHLQQELGRKRV